jgi:hypothetical protein
MNKLQEAQVTQINHSISWSTVLRTLIDYEVWMYMFVFLGLVTPGISLSVFLATIIRAWGFESLDAQLYSFPPYLFAAAMVIFISYLSDRYCNRFWFLFIPSSISAACLFALAFTQPTQHHILISYLLVIFSIVGISCSIPICLSWLSNNMMLDVTRKSVATAMVVSFGNIGGAFGGHIYRQDDAPFYKRGHLIICGFVLWALIWSLFLKLLYVHRNRKLAQKDDMISNSDQKYRE